MREGGGCAGSCVLEAGCKGVWDVWVRAEEDLSTWGVWAAWGPGCSSRSLMLDPGSVAGSMWWALLCRSVMRVLLVVW